MSAAGLGGAEVIRASGCGLGEDWSSWYAAYLVAEQAGTDLPT